MAIADELLHQLRDEFSDQRLPGVRALHLPRDVAVGGKDGEADEAEQLSEKERKKELQGVFVIDTEQMQHRGMQIANREFVLDRRVSEFVGAAVCHPAFHPGAAQQLQQ